MIDFSNAIAAGATSITLQMGSTTGGEKWAIFGSNSATSGYSQILTGLNDEASHTLTGANLDKFYYFTIASGFQPFKSNVLLGDISTVASAVPEPFTVPQPSLRGRGNPLSSTSSRSPKTTSLSGRIQLSSA